MKNLGTTTIKIPPGSIVRRIIIEDDKGHRIGACAIVPTKPEDGDWLDIEFDYWDVKAAKR